MSAPANPKDDPFDIDRLRAEAVKQVGAILIRQTESVDRLVQASVEYAAVVTKRDLLGAPEVVVDAGALIRALVIEAEALDPKVSNVLEHATGFSLAWDDDLGIVSQWMAETRLTAIVEPEKSLKTRLTGFDDADVKLSVTMRSRVLPAAIRYAAEYGAEAPVELFHLIEALIGLGAEKWQSWLNGTIGQSQLERLGRMVSSAGRERPLPQPVDDARPVRAAFREDTPVLEDAPSRSSCD